MNECGTVGSLRMSTNWDSPRLHRPATLRPRRRRRRFPSYCWRLSPQRSHCFDLFSFDYNNNGIGCSENDALALLNEDGMRLVFGLMASNHNGRDDERMVTVGASI